MKRIVGRLLQRVVVAVRGGVGFRIVDRVMIQVCLERLGGVVPARVTWQRRQSGRIVWDRASMGAAVICELEAGQLGYVNRRIGRMRSIVGLRERMKRVIGRLLVVDVRIGTRVMVQLAGIGAAVISQLGAGRFDSVNSKAWVSSIGNSR